MGRRLARLVAALSLTGALALVAMTLLPLAATAAPPKIAYAGKATAAGIQFSFDSSPSLTPVQGLFDVRSPTGTSTLSSAGESDGVASLAHPGNSANGLSLLCGADPNLATFCDGLSQVTTQTPLGPFPIDYPLAAHASYPADDGKPVNATVGNPQTIGDGPVQMFPGKAQAQAVQEEVTTSSAMGSTSFLAGLPASVTTGSVTADTHQIVKNGALVVESTSTVKDVVIGGVVRIGQIDTIATASNDGQGKLTKSGKVTVSNVTALGMPATIDEKGITVESQGDKGQLLGSVNDALQKSLVDSGISMKLVGVDESATKNAVSVSAAGVLVTYSRKIDQNPDPTDAIRELVPCLPAEEPCLLGVPSPNATYFGSYLLGNSAVDDFAAPVATFDIGSLFPGGLPGSFGKPASTTFIPGTPGAPGEVIAPIDGGVAPVGGEALEQPEIAGGDAGAAQGRLVRSGDILSGTNDELKKLFPALFLGVLGLLAGRFARYPARFPRR